MSERNTNDSNEEKVEKRGGKRLGSGRKSRPVGEIERRNTTITLTPEHWQVYEIEVSKENENNKEKRSKQTITGYFNEILAREARKLKRKQE